MQKPIAILNKDKFFLAKEQTGPNASEAELVAKYKQLGGAYVEGKEQIKITPRKYIIFFEKKTAKPKKKIKKGKK